MRSPALAIAWELRQRHRYALVALAGYALAFVAVWPLILGPGELTLDPPNGRAAAVMVPLSAAFLYFLAVFSFGLGGDLAARQSPFPARLFTLPVATRALAGWPMLFGTAAVASLWLLTAPFVRWSGGPDLPLIWPALLGAVFLAWTQVLTWTAYGLPGLRIVATVLWLAALDAAVILAVQLEVPEPRLVAMLAPQLPLAYLAACFVVGRARRGDVPDWRVVFARASRVAPDLSPRPDRFPSPFRAQLWFEWRQQGRVLPALVAILLPFELGLLFLARDEPPVLVGLTLLGVLLTPPLMAGFTAVTADQPGRDGGDSSGVTLTATRPLTSAALVAARLEAAVWSTLVAWLIVLVAVPLALALTGTWPAVADAVVGVVDVVGRPRAIVLALLGFAGLLASTWKQLVQSLGIALSGRAWLIRTNVLARLALLVIVWPVGDWVVGNGTVVIAALWEAGPWVLAVVACFKVSAAAWVVQRLHRSRLLGDRSLVRGAASWLAVVLALYAVLVWLVATPLIPRYLPALVAILAVPLARLSAAPLALAWSRHRGATGRADPESRTSLKSQTRVMGAVGVLLGLPLVLALVEAVSYEVRNRTNGTLVSSGREREYLLHVPASYDPAKPTPLVISMHGGAGWPALQRETSRWSTLADRQGFIVVYPSGIGGRGPRAWHMSPAGLARDVRFISDLIDALEAAYNIDATRIYADGLSNGGGMAFALSCTLSDRIAAVGMVASAQLLPFDWCTDPRAVPMIAFHGTADRTVPYHGGRSWVAPKAFPDMPTWAARWARRNRCRAEPVESAVAADVTRLEYTQCADDAAVALYTVHEGGHSWPGGGPLPEWLVGPTSRSIDATSLMWAFFREHRLAAGEGEEPTLPRRPRGVSGVPAERPSFLGALRSSAPKASGGERRDQAKSTRASRGSASGATPRGGASPGCGRRRRACRRRTPRPPSRSPPPGRRAAPARTAAPPPPAGRGRTPPPSGSPPR
jgi:polyhydroxybutyrate depolymerase